MLDHITWFWPYFEPWPKNAWLIMIQWTIFKILIDFCTWQNPMVDHTEWSEGCSLNRHTMLDHITWFWPYFEPWPKNAWLIMIQWTIFKILIDFCTWQNPMVDRTEWWEGCSFYFLFLIYLDPSPKNINLNVVHSVYMNHLIFFCTCRNLSLLSFISLKVLVHVWRATEYFGFCALAL
jgi:hypothetical protein